MRILSCSVVLLFLVGCSSGDSVETTPPPTSCSNDQQKQFVLDALYGPLWLRLVIGHEPIRAADAAATVDAVWSGIAIED